MRWLLTGCLLLTACAVPPPPLPSTPAGYDLLASGSGSDGTSGSGSSGSGSGSTGGTSPTAATGQALKPWNFLPDLDGDPHNGRVMVDLAASEVMVPLLTGPLTKMMVFNGTYPGPIIRCYDGDQVTVRFKNHLSQATAVHFHGMVIEPEHDGGPWNAVAPGGSHTYTWRAKAGLPMTGWFHAHPHGMTHIQVPRGMVGMIHVLDRNDPVPPDYGDTSLLFTDNKFTAGNQIPADTEFDRFNGREGDRVFVNGQILPTMTMRPGEIRRVRLLDGGPARFYDLTAPGLTMYHIGTDGGLFGPPARISHLIMGVAERNEVLLQAPRVPGRFKLQSLPHDRGLGLREKFTRDLMTIEVAGMPVTPTPIPAILKPVMPLSLSGAKQRFIELGASSAGNGIKHFTMNEKRFDAIRVDGVGQIGDTEIVTMDNKQGNWSHPMHLHSVQFQELDSSGRPIPRWKDVLVTPRSTNKRFAVKYGVDEFPGVFMFHCHILQHEDDGMMTHIFVNPLPADQP